MAEPARPRGLSSALSYRDQEAALKWLEDAFGFELVFVVRDEAGRIGHSEMRFGDTVVMIGGEWSEKHKSPQSLGGINTQSIHIHIDSDVNAHCERARKAGAVIWAEPETQFYGDRTYRAIDPEGHVWTVGQTVEVLSLAEMEKKSGFKIETSQ